MTSLNYPCGYKLRVLREIGHIGENSYELA